MQAKFINNMEKQRKNTNIIRNTRERKNRGMQANLLALNAFFEAARAGKNGLELARAAEKASPLFLCPTEVK
ncbi:MAG: hypothetical protein AVO38_06420 [delta proteobacterium ML8_D]|nr:MAG: hypothetical protein AVO38_06420 [delta proteobacterium ML8_D]